VPEEKKEMTRRAAGGMDPDMKALLLLPMIVAPLLLAGCNTVKGFGEDISGTASWTQEKMTGSSSSKSSDSDYVQNPPQFPKSN
jgi:predicted small secreted protein